MDSLLNSHSQLNNSQSKLTENEKVKISLDIKDSNYLFNKLKYKEPVFFSYAHLDRNIKNLKKDNLRKFKFINNHLEIELNKNPNKNGLKNNLIMSTASTFHKKEENIKLKALGSVSALTDEEIVFNRIYDRHLNNLMQIKDYNMPKNTVIKTKDQIKKSMINFFSRGEVNSKIISIKNKIFLMKGVMDYSLPLINTPLKNDDKEDCRDDMNKSKNKFHKKKMSGDKTEKSNKKNSKKLKSKHNNSEENELRINNLALNLNQNQNTKNRNTKHLSEDENKSGYINIKELGVTNNKINDDVLRNEIDQIFNRNEYNYHTIEENDSERSNQSSNRND